MPCTLAALLCTLMQECPGGRGVCQPPTKSVGFKRESFPFASLSASSVDPAGSRLEPLAREHWRMAHLHPANPERPPCWHCQHFGEMLAGGAAARCARGGSVHVQAAPAHGCVYWEREPGSDDEPGPPETRDGSRPPPPLRPLVNPTTPPRGGYSAPATARATALARTDAAKPSHPAAARPAATARRATAAM